MEKEGRATVELPPGFHFEPSARQLLGFYLRKKVMGEAEPYLSNIIPYCDIYGNGAEKDPWNIFGTRSPHSFYVFTKLIKKKVESKRVERRAGCGTRKLQQSEEIYKEYYYGPNNKKQKQKKNKKEEVIGYKKLLVFEVKDEYSKNEIMGIG